MAAVIQAFSTPDEMVSAYIRLRDHKQKAVDEFKKSMEKIDLAMAKLENKLLEHLNNTGIDSLTIRGVGTAYVSEKFSATVKDRDEFLKFIESNDCTEALDVRANKTVIKDLLKSLPEVPGVKTTTMLTVNVRRS